AQARRRRSSGGWRRTAARGRRPGGPSTRTRCRRRTTWTRPRRGPGARSSPAARRNCSPRRCPGKVPPPLVSLAQPQIRALVSRVPMPSENLAGRTIAGYRLLERVGEGGTAEVYRAEHPERGAAALMAAHQAGIIHRDLKPENIVYDATQQTVKLLDFGIARDAELPPEERLTRTGFFVGTLKYVAPEALSGELVDGRADIYSLATITYWLLTGQHPHTGRTPRELFQPLLTPRPLPLSQAAPDRRFPPPPEAAVTPAPER